MPIQRQAALALGIFILAIFNGATSAGSGIPKVSVKAATMTDLKLKLQAKLEAFRKTRGVPGATLGFVLPDGRSGSVATGYSDLEKKTPMQPNDKMLSASIGKSYASAVMLQLVEEGKVNLNEKIEYWFGTAPWFNRLPNANDITLRILMNHTSGIPDHRESKRFSEAVSKDPGRTWTPQELVATILDEQPLFPAGKGWSYADTNYILVGLIIEKVTGKTYYDEMTRRILQPLQLDDTHPSNTRIIPGMISGYANPKAAYGLPAKICVDGDCILNPQNEWTGGGLVSTSLDTAKWFKDLFAGNVLKKSSLNEMLLGVGPTDLPGHKYGLAIYIRSGEWGTSYGHGGDMPGYRSGVDYFPQYDLALAIQVNTDNFGTGDDMHLTLDSYIDEAARIIIDEEQLQRK